MIAFKPRRGERRTAARGPCLRPAGACKGFAGMFPAAYAAGYGALHGILGSFAGRAASGKLSGVRRALNVIGTVLLLICLVSMLRWVGGMRSDRDADAGEVWGTDQRAIGLYCGVFYDFDCWFGREDIRPGGPLWKVTGREFSWEGQRAQGRPPTLRREVADGRVSREGAKGGNSAS